MKKQILFLVVFIAAAFLVHAQAPNAIPYQGVARNAGGNILASQPISLRISIHDVTATGTVVFSETHAVTTNTLGLFNVNIGSGTAITGTLTGVDWGNGAKFIQVEMDPAGGIAYADMGTTQLNSVPYALYAGNANSGNFVDLTTNQTIAGSKFFTSDLSVNGMRLGGDGGALFNTYFGTDALLNNQGSANTAVGMWALKNSTTTSGNTAVGTWALSENTTGGYNSAFGNAALTSSTIGTANTAIGQTNLGNNTTGSYNTALGHNSMMGNSTGNANTTLGSNADVGAGNLENATAIGFNAIVDASNKVQIGNVNLNAVQLGTGSNVTLETGLVKLTGGTPGAGKVLTSDANGLASWQSTAGLVGPAGPTGPQGPAGNDGAPGATGPQGPQGVPGNDGATGAQGPIGLTGATGATGPQGPAGLLTSGTSAGNTPYWNGTSWVTNSSNIFNNGGFVGIGNSSPDAMLQLGDGDGNRKLVIWDEMNNDHQYHGFGTNPNVLRYQVDAISASHVFYAGISSTASNELMRIRGNGNVGIGTNNPGAKLEVAGQIKITGGTPGADKVLTSDANGLASWQSTAGLVGPAGPTGPQGPAGATGATGPQGPQGPAGLLTSGSAAGNTPYWNGSSWITNSSNIFNNGGNVGIGTAAPGSQFHIADAVGVQNNPSANMALSRVWNSASDTRASSIFHYYSTATTNDALAFGVSGGGGTNGAPNTLAQIKMLIQASGNVGIGTTAPGTKLDVSRADAAGDGDAISFGSQTYKMGKLGENTSDNGVYLANVYGTNAYIDFRVAGNAVANTKMRVHGNGNVGIGSTSPVTKLDITKSTAFNATTPGLGYYNLHLSAPQNGVNDEATGITFGTTNNLNAQAGIYVQNSALYGTKMSFGTTNNYGIGSQTRMTIDNLGNVGIGTSTSYNSKLVIKGANPNTGNSLFTDWQTSEDTDDQRMMLFYLGSTNASNRAFAFQTTLGTVANPAIISLQPSNGNVAIGQVPSIGAKLHAGLSTNGVVARFDGGAGKGLTIQTVPGGVELVSYGGTSSPNYSSMVLRTGATPAIYINESGNVGIGSNTLYNGYKLSVTGDVCSTGDFWVCSDIRYKKDIRPLQNSLEKVLQIKGVNYYWKSSEFPEYQFSNNKQIGFIAQDIEKLFPELVFTGNDGYKSVEYSKLTPILVEAIKELKAENEKLKSDIELIKKHLGINSQTSN